MRKPITISVVIPTYNEAGTIRRAIQSVLDQTCQADEIIVVDDGSVDGTTALVRDFFPSVRLFTQANAGAGAARNLGIQASNGSHIAFLDADDRWLPDKLAKQLAYLEQDPKIALISSAVRYVFASRDCRTKPTTEQYHAGLETVTFHGLLRNNVILTSSAIVNADLARRLGGFDPGLRRAQDFDFWLRLAYEGKVCRVDDILVEYTVDPDCSSAKIERNIACELALLAKWSPARPDTLDINHILSQRYYDRTMQWWRLKFAHRFFNLGSFAEGRAHLKAAIRPLGSSPLLSLLAAVGCLFPRLFLAVSTRQRARIYRKVGNLTPGG